MRLLSWLLVNVLALGLAVWLFDGIRLDGEGTQGRLLTLVVVGGILGLVGAIVKPLVTLVSLPFIILTLGLLLLVINAAMLLLTARIADAIGFGLQVDSFLTAVGGGLVIAIASAILGGLLRDE